MRPFPGWIRGLPAVALVLVVGGCAARPGFVLGGDCELSSECAAPLVCRLGRCREECRSDRDCRAGLVCLRDDGLGACELEGESCVLSSDCPPSLVCLMGRCANACEEDVDCPPGHSCVPAPDDPDGPRGCRDQFMMPCELNSECGEPRICAPDGHCREPCHTTRDCRDGLSCLGVSPNTTCGYPDAGTTLDAGPTDAPGLDAPGLDAPELDAPELDAGAIDGAIADAGIDAAVDGGVVTGAAPDPMLAAGDFHTCAVSGGETRCWGEDADGELGDDVPLVDRSSPTPVMTIATSVVRLAAGVNHTCASTAGSIYCWGDNLLGEVGDGMPTAIRPTPVLLSGGAATSIAAARDHTCAIRGGRVECWGDNTSGQLGDGTTLPRRTPTPTLALAGTPIEVSARGATTCALLSDGRIQCWGANDYGQLGNGTVSAGATSMPTLVSSITDAVEVAVGVFHACARRRSGAVLCWGSHERGAVGDGTTPMPGLVRETPTPVAPELPPAVELAAGGEHVCARALDGRVFCWGGNALGQVGVNNLVLDQTIETPAAVAGITGALEIGAGDSHSCARVAGGLRCWGGNSRGQLGNGSIGGTSYTPVAVVPWP